MAPPVAPAMGTPTLNPLPSLRTPPWRTTGTGQRLGSGGDATPSAQALRSRPKGVGGTQK